MTPEEDLEDPDGGKSLKLQNKLLNKFLDSVANSEPQMPRTPLPGQELTNINIMSEMSPNTLTETLPSRSTFKQRQ